MITGESNVWFYDMKADGFSLDDKRAMFADGAKHENNNIPDILARWRAFEAEASRFAHRSIFLCAAQRDCPQ